MKRESEPSIIVKIKDQTIKLIDSATISLCLNMFDWAKFQTAKGSLKIQTCRNDNLQIPDLVNITPKDKINLNPQYFIFTSIEDFLS